MASIRELRKASTAAKHEYLRALRAYNRAFLRYAKAKKFAVICWGKDALVSRYDGKRK